MSKNSYGWEKLHLAVRFLAASNESVQDRLRDAFIYHIIHIEPENLPDADSRKKLSALKKALTKGTPVGNEGSVAATTNKMSAEEAVEHIHTITDLYDRVAQTQGA